MLVHGEVVQPEEQQQNTPRQWTELTMKHILQIHESLLLKSSHILLKIPRKSNLSEDLQVSIVQEIQPRFSLNSP